MTATGHLPQITCARCGDPIDAAKPYVVISVWWTRANHAEPVARVHENCTEGLTQGLLSAVSTR